MMLIMPTKNAMEQAEAMEIYHEFVEFFLSFTIRKQCRIPVATRLEEECLKCKGASNIVNDTAGDSKWHGEFNSHSTN